MNNCELNMAVSWEGVGHADEKFSFNNFSLTLEVVVNLIASQDLL